MQKSSPAFADAASIPASSWGEPAIRPLRVPVPDEFLVAVLDAVRVGGCGSRQEVARATGFGRGVVAQRVAELVASGLLVEGGIGPSTGGRPPRQFSFHGEAGHLYAAFLGATSIDVAVTDAGGEVLRRISEPCDISTGPDVILDRVDDLFARLAERTSPASGPLWGIGIGVPGPVEFSTGRPVSPPIMPGWDRYPIRERFAARHGVPVWVDNDVNVMALGEWRYGEARDNPDVVFVKVGTGVGAGVISDGRLHRGAQGSAGDVGHIQVTDDQSVVCRCGNTGCLEAMAGGAALARQGERAARDGRSRWLKGALLRSGSVTAFDVADAASHGDPVSVELIQASGRYIGTMLAAIVNFFNPSLIVLGGGVVEAGDLFMASIRQVIYGRSLPLATRDLLVRRSELGDVAGLQGAAAMVLDELFSRSLLPEWLAAGTPSALLEVVPIHG